MKTIEQLPQVPVNESLAQLPMLEETEKAIKQLSNGKGPGADSIPAEIYKTGGMKLKEKITEFSADYGPNKVSHRTTKMH